MNLYKIEEASPGYYRVVLTDTELEVGNKVVLTPPLTIDWCIGYISAVIRK